MTREEALQAIKAKMDYYESDKRLRGALETLIPELCESEDERIRKEIIDFIQWAEERGMTRHDYHQAKRPSEWIAYLERQKEQKPEEVEQNPLIRMMEDKKAITEDIRNGIPTKTIEKERNVKFATPVDVSHAEWSEDKFPKDIEKDAAQFCFDKGINITPHQAKQIATHYLIVGHNEGYLEGRKNAHIPARELGLPSSCDFHKEQKPVDYDHEMWKNCEANFEGGKKEVINNPEKYGLCRSAEWREEGEK